MQQAGSSRRWIVVIDIYERCKTSYCCAAGLSAVDVVILKPHEYVAEENKETFQTFQ